MRWLVLLVVVGLAGCATDPAPRAVQQTAIGAAIGVSGGMIALSSAVVVGGTLLVTDPDNSALRSGLLINAGIGALVGITVLSVGSVITLNAQDDLKAALRRPDDRASFIPRHSRDDEDGEPPRRSTLGFQ